MMRFNHTMIFFKLTDKYKISYIYVNRNNCLGHMLINMSMSKLVLFYFNNLDLENCF